MSVTSRSLRKRAEPDPGVAASLGPGAPALHSNRKVEIDEEKIKVKA